jgi:glycosyltransferase involved in cell wall biosynthesis
MTKKIKILLTIPNFDTAGSGRSVYDTIKGLNKNIFEVEVCCFHDKGSLFQEIKKTGVKIHLFQYTATYRPFLTFPFRLLKIYRFMKTNNFDIIHSWHWSSDFSEPLAARLSGVSYVYSKKAMGWGNKAWTWRSKLSTKIVAVNEEMLNKYFSSMMHKVVQIPLCVNTFKPMSKSYCTPENLEFKESDFIVISVANLVAVKGIELLIEAVNSLNDNSIKVLIVGDYENEYGLSLKAKYEDADRIFFTGKRLDVKPYLAVADVFVIPTKDEGRREGLPIAPMEAMSSKRIVLGSNITGVREVLKTFPECIFEPSDIRGIAEKILWVKSMTENERQKLATAMRSYVEKELSIKRFIEEHETMYKQIMNIN